ncbi:MAG: ArsR/SmtB family transcription factor [Mycobacteriales bacterium]
MPRVDPAEINELHARICKALADPKRLMIISELREGPRSVGDIANELGVSQPNASQHLAVLRDRGMVRSTRRQSQVYYELTSPKIVEAVDLLRSFMAEQFGQTPAGSQPLAAR